MQAKSLKVEECQDLKKLGLKAMSVLTHDSYEINMQQRLLLKNLTLGGNTLHFAPPNCHLLIFSLEKIWKSI